MRGAPAGRASVIAMNLPFIEKPNGHDRDQRKQLADLRDGHQRRTLQGVGRLMPPGKSVQDPDYAAGMPVSFTCA